MSSGAWVAVVAAVLAASAVAGALFTLPAWLRRGAGRPVAVLLALQGGAALVVGAIGVGAAARSWHLVGEPPTRHVSHALMTVSRVDGDGSMFALVLLAIVGIALLAAAVLFLSAHLVVGDAPSERTVTCVVLGLEVGLCGYGLAAVVGGTHTPATIVAVINLPLAMAALVASWPPRTLTDSP